MRTKKFSEFKKAVRDYLVENSQYSPMVTTRVMGETYPKVVIEKQNDREVGSDTFGMTREYVNTITFYIYTKTMVFNGRTVSMVTIAEELEELLKELMTDYYGFRLTFDGVTPVLDNEIYRKQLNYSVRTLTR